MWIRKVQRHIPEDTESNGWRLEKDERTKILRCVGRIQGYSPVYLENGLFVKKLTRHVHEQRLHPGVASTMGAIREEWRIPRLRSLVKKMINGCHTCKVFSTKQYGKTSPLPTFARMQASPFIRRVSILLGRLQLFSYASCSSRISRRLPKNSVIS